MPGTVQAVERAAAILRLLAVRGTPLALGEIAAALGLAKTTAHGLLRTLLEVDFVSQEPGSGRYILGDTLRHLGAGSVDVNELRSKSMNWADTLASRSGEAVRLATSGDDGVVVIHHVFRPDDTVQRLDTGAVLPAHATALGKLLVAHDDTLAATVRAADRPAFTRRTVTASVELDRELAGVREAGWIAEIGQFRPGEASIAAVLRSPGGLVVGAVGVSGAIDRLCESGSRPRPTLVGLVRDTAAAITRALRYPV